MYLSVQCLRRNVACVAVRSVNTFNSWLDMANVNAKAMSTESQKSLIGVCQLTCTADKQKNFDICKNLIWKATKQGAQMVFLPEAVDYIGETKQKSMEMAESLKGETILKYKQLAQETGSWISIGGFHQKSDKGDDPRILNTHVIIDNYGIVKATYSKTHLFDLNIPGKVRLCESDYTIPGDRVVSPVKTPVGNVGLQICYDLRFPEMSVALTQQGAEILTFPSAFTVTTGQAHWEILLRNRAIENQCYVVAAAQTGQHNSKRSSYGHSMVVDPWGRVIAQCAEEEGICMAEIDLTHLHKVRTEMPVWNHRRHDLYGHIHINRPESLDDRSEYDFGGHIIPSSCVFHQSPISFCFVNIKPVVPGHVLVSPLRRVEKFAELSQHELSDLFCTVQKVSNVVQHQYGASSVTVSIQDGVDSGQTVKHVHVHVLPRKPGDFVKNDEIYEKLQNHDNDLEGKRTLEEMAEEATQLRHHFTRQPS